MSWLIAGENGALNQFASGLGYTELIAALDGNRADFPALESLVEHGISEQVPEVIADLSRFIDKQDDPDVLSVAEAMKGLLHGLEVAIVTSGESDLDEDGSEPGEIIYGEGQDETPLTEEDLPADPEADKADFLFGDGRPSPGLNFDGLLVRKAASLPPLQRDGIKVIRARRQFANKLGEFFRKTAADLARQVLEFEPPEAGKVAKAKPKTAAELAAQLTRIDWDELIPEAEDALTEIAREGGYAALAQLEISDTKVINEVNDVAGDWASGRAAEMVGKKWVDGELVDNPNPKWAITETTRDDIRQIVENAFQQNTSMKDLAAQIQEAGAFSDYRANMIARTEALNSETQGNLAGWEASGMVESYKWTLSADHDDADDCNCSDNADGSPYAYDELPDYPDHPHEMCSLSVARLKGEESDEDEDVEDAVGAGDLRKAVAAFEDLAKYSEGEARDESGRWTSGGAATPKHVGNVKRTLSQGCAAVGTRSAGDEE